MNEVARLSYLEAMGIESYVPRIILPGALPSALCEIEERVEIETQETTSSKDALKQLQASLVTTQANKTEAVPVQKQPAVQHPQHARSAAPATTQVSVRFHWAIFQPTAAMLLLVPSAHTDQHGLQLLKKILSAIGIVAPLAPLENFVWPPVAGNTSRQVSATSSLSDAKETLHALLEGYQLKQKKSQTAIEHVLVFDENLGKMLFEGESVPGMHVRILPSLQLMLTSSPEKVAELKQAAWQRIKDLKK